MPLILKILHLEDDPAISEWIACTLSGAGLNCQLQRVELKSDFETALQQQWDLVLIDYLLPDIDGLEALYLSLKYQPSVPAIIISGELDEEVIVSFLKHGATDYVLKQRMERLLPVIQRALTDAKIQRQLNNAETQIADIASNVPGALYQFSRHSDGNYAIPWCSPAFESLMHVTAAEIQRTAEPAFARVITEDVQQLIDAIEQSARELQRWDCEFRISDLKGEIRWLHGISTPHPHPDGSIYWNGILLDITTRKKAESKARAEALLNEAVLGTVAAAVLVLDRQARIIRFNHTCEIISGYGETELLGKEIWSLLPPEQRENVKTLFSQTRPNHFPNQYEGYWFTRDNQTRLLSWSNTCITDSKGMVEYIVATGIDITEKRQYEEALDEYRQDLEKRVTERTSTIEQQEIFIRSIINSLSSEIIVLDQRGNITHVNDAWEQFAQCNNAPSSVIKGIHCNYLNVCKTAIGKHSEYGHKAYVGINDVLSGIRQQFVMEYPCDAPEQTRWFAMSVLPLQDDSGGVVILHIDITDRKKNEAELIEAKENAELANRTKTLFLSNMSHEFRTPLNAIVGFSQLLKMSSSLNEDSLDCAEEIHRAGQHLLALISDLLDLSRIETGNLKLTLESVDLLKVISECKNLVRPLAGCHEIKLEFDEISLLHNPFVYADKMRLKQVMLNLISNAIKYNTIGGFVRISFEQDLEFTHLIIQDSGIGISREQLAKLFNPFERLDNEYREIEGTGIGLVITKNLLDLMHGSITVESTVGKGSLFTVSLPKSRITMLQAVNQHI